MDFSYPGTDYTEAFRTMFLVLFFVGGGLSTAWAIAWAVFRDWRELTRMLGFIAIGAVVATTAVTAMALKGSANKEDDTQAEQIIPSQIQEVYGLDVSPESAEELRTFFYPEDKYEEYPEPSGYLTSDDMKLERATNTVTRYGTTTLYVDGVVTEVQLVWADGWRLLDAETDEELPRQK